MEKANTVNGTPYWTNLEIVNRRAMARIAAEKKLGEVKEHRKILKAIEAEWRAAHPLAKAEAQKAVNKFSGRGVIRPAQAGHLVAAGKETLTIKDALDGVRAVSVWAADNTAAIVGATYVAAARRGTIAVKVGSKWMTLAQYAHDNGILRADVNRLTAPKAWESAVKAARKLAEDLGVKAVGAAK